MTFAGRGGSLSALLNGSGSDVKTKTLTRAAREGKYDKENFDPEQDAEIAAFMGKARPRVSPSKVGGEDMDCIQGLLSLSQGAWR